MRGARARLLREEARNDPFAPVDAFTLQDERTTVRSSRRKYRIWKRWWVRRLA